MATGGRWVWLGMMVCSSLLVASGLGTRARLFEHDSTASRAVRLTIDVCAAGRVARDVHEHNAATRDRGTQVFAETGGTPGGDFQANSHIRSVSSALLNVRAAWRSRRNTTATSRQHAVPPPPSLRHQDFTKSQYQPTHHHAPSWAACGGSSKEMVVLNA